MPLSQGLKLARQRRIILEELLTARSHHSANEVCALGRRRLPRVSGRKGGNSEPSQLEKALACKSA